MILGDLASVAYQRGDLEEAEAGYRRALALRQQLSPDSPRTRGVQSNLGLVARKLTARNEAAG